jgi:hypothetical protein
MKTALIISIKGIKNVLLSSDVLMNNGKGIGEQTRSGKGY